MACFPASPASHTPRLYMPHLTYPRYTLRCYHPIKCRDITEIGLAGIRSHIHRCVCLLCEASNTDSDVIRYHTSRADNGPTLAMPPPLPSSVTTAVSRRYPWHLAVFLYNGYRVTAVSELSHIASGPKNSYCRLATLGVDKPLRCECGGRCVRRGIRRF